MECNDKLRFNRFLMMATSTRENQLADVHGIPGENPARVPKRQVRVQVVNILECLETRINHGISKNSYRTCRTLLILNFEKFFPGAPS